MVDEIANFIKKYNGEFYVLDCRQNNYLTIFQMKKRWDYKMATEGKELVDDLGTLKGYDVCADMVEIWITGEDDECRMYALYGYDGGTIIVG